MAGTAAYLALMDYSYVHDLSVRYGYMGFRNDSSASPEAVTTAWLLALLPATWLPLRLERPSRLFTLVLYVSVYGPALVLSARTGVDLQGGVLGLGAQLLACLLVVDLIGRLPRTSLRPGPGLEVRAVRVVVGLLFVLALYGMVVSRFGIPSRLPRLTEAYDARAAMKAEVIHGGRLVVYATMWLGNAVNPLLILVGLIRRRPLPVVLGVVGQFYLFSLGGMKSFLGALILVPVTYWLSDPERDDATLAGFSWVLAGVAASAAFLSSTAVGSVCAYVVRRGLVVPGMLTGYYLEFFGDNPKAMLSHSVLARFVPRNYEMAPADLIGNLYTAGSHSNANVWADGFANFGFGGMLAASALLGAVGYVTDAGAPTGIRRRMAVALMVMPAIAVGNSAVLTSLLTHGIGLVVLIVWLLPEAWEESGSEGARRALREAAGGE